MMPVVVPTSDVNSERATVVTWFAASRTAVEAGALLVEVETSKSVFEVAAPEAASHFAARARGHRVLPC